MEDVGDIVVIQLLNNFGQRLGLPVRQCGIAELVRQFIDDQYFLLRFEKASSTAR